MVKIAAVNSFFDIAAGGAVQMAAVNAVFTTFRSAGAGIAATLPALAHLL